MVEDARFEDAGERPLNLSADDAEGLAVIAALVQDAVLTVGDMRWDRRARRFAMLVNRFRWEDREAAERARRPYERARAVLVVGDVTAVASQGIDRSDRDSVLSVLGLAWKPEADGTGSVVVTLAGDGAIRLTAECLDVTLKDVTRPYAAPSGKAPSHPDCPAPAPARRLPLEHGGTRRYAGGRSDQKVPPRCPVSFRHAIPVSRRISRRSSAPGARVRRTWVRRCRRSSPT
jgi:hypothetical protein